MNVVWDLGVIMLTSAMWWKVENTKYKMLQILKFTKRHFTKEYLAFVSQTISNHVVIMGGKTIEIYKC